MSGFGEFALRRVSTGGVRVSTGTPAASTDLGYCVFDQPGDLVSCLRQVRPLGGWSKTIGTDSYHIKAALHCYVQIKTVWGITKVGSKAGAIQTGLVPGKWMLATEEGCWNVYVYQFDKEADARRAFESLHICRILYDPTGTEVDHHDGGNFLALGTIRKHTRDRTPPSHDLPRENGTAPAAAMAVGGAAGGAVGGAIAVPVTLGIVNSLGFTSAGIAAGSTAAAMMSAEAVAAGGAVASGGLVATLQAVGAAGLMAGGPAFVAATVLLPAVACAAVGVGIAAGISHFSRGAYSSGLEGGSQTGLVPGKWMLATEEGCWNVYVYQFDKEADARRAFESLHICRILYDPSGAEVAHHDGGNFMALGTVRRHTRDRTPI